MVIETIKFSEFTDSGDLANDDITVGYGGGVNTRYTNPWTFLAPGPTGDRPIPATSMYYRLRFNTTLEIYEYYDPTIPIWVELSGSGTGTVNPGVANDIAFYAASGQSVSPIAGAANSVLVTNGSKVPSLSTTLPSGLTVPGATITSSTAALTAGSVVAAPVSGPDIVNKTYADSLFGSGVSSATGTTNQVLVNGVAGVPTSGAITLSLPQDIALGSTPTFAGLTLSSMPLNPASGGTGINNGSKTITLGGNLTTSGAFASTFTMTGVTTVTFPTSGTLATTSQIPTGTALTKTDDTNVTLTLGGSPTTALVNAASLTLGWTGLLGVARGGTGVGSVTTSPTASAFSGWDVNSNLSAKNFLPGFTSTVSAAGNTTLTVASNMLQEITGSTTQTVTMPVTSTLASGQPYIIMNNSSGAVTVNSSGGNAIQVMAANTSLYLNCVLTSGTTAASWNKSYIFDNGAGVESITGTANQVIASASTGPITLSLPQSIATSSNVTFGSVGFSSTSGIIGTTTNNNAAAGSVGEVISSTILFASRAALTTGTLTNITSVSLTAGDWDVYGNVGISSTTSSISSYAAGLSTTSVTLPDPAFYSSGNITASSVFTNPVPLQRLSLSGTTTVYLVVTSTVGGTPAMFGNITARRRR